MSGVMSKPSKSNSKGGSLCRAYASLQQLKKSGRGGSSGSRYSTPSTYVTTTKAKLDKLEERERKCQVTAAEINLEGSNQRDLLVSRTPDPQVCVKNVIGSSGELLPSNPEAIQNPYQPPKETRIVIETGMETGVVTGVVTASLVGEENSTSEIGSANIGDATSTHGEQKDLVRIVDTAYSTLSKQQKEELAEQLVFKEKMWGYFSELVVDAAADAVEEKVEESKVRFKHAREVDMAQVRSEHRFANVCNLPLKLILTPLSRGGKFIRTFASILEIQFGPLHAALQVGDVILEWNDSSLVIPHFCAHEDRVLVADVQHQTSWVEFTSKQYPKIKEATDQMDYSGQIELVYALAAEKTQCINRLIDVIVRYNRLHYYDLIVRNCQHFVCDALEALGVKQPDEFRGGLAEYFEALKSGRTKSLPGMFKDHSDLDEHIEQNQAIDTMPIADLEYLLAQYFQFHLKSKNQLEKNSAALDNWSCPVSGCRMPELEKRIDLQSLRIHNFRTI